MTSKALEPSVGFVWALAGFLGVPGNPGEVPVQEERNGISER